MRISDWSSDVCSSDLLDPYRTPGGQCDRLRRVAILRFGGDDLDPAFAFANRADRMFLEKAGGQLDRGWRSIRAIAGRDQRQRKHLTDRIGQIALRDQAEPTRSEEHTSELQSLMH